MGLNKDLVAASAEPLILSILSQEESYGYAIIKKVSAFSRGQIAWTEGMLYPVLHRLEKRGAIRSHWRISETGRKRKYYQILSTGRAQLESSLEEWDKANALILAVRGALHV